MRLLLDTSVLIDALRLRRGRRQLLADLVRAGHALATSSLNIAEVYAGMRPGEEVQTDAFLSALECYDITSAVGHRAGNLKSEWSRRGRTLTLPDAVIAAVALERGCTLMTDNVKDFPANGLELYSLATE
jgi:predicted nucleic acid-binding protein